MVNTGVAVHQMHFHGNHIWTFRRENVELSRSTADASPRTGTSACSSGRTSSSSTRCSAPTSCCRSSRRRTSSRRVWAARTTDWTYPMHCHAEMSQSAGGGVYPGGLVADWVLAGGTPPDGGV